MDPMGTYWQLMYGENEWKWIEEEGHPNPYFPRPDATLTSILKYIRAGTASEKEPINFIKADHEIRFETERNYWISQAFKRAGIPIDADWDPQKGYMHNRDISIKAYNYYESMFLLNPQKYLWPGLAKVAGASVHLGLRKGEAMKAENQQVINKALELQKLAAQDEDDETRQAATSIIAMKSMVNAEIDYFQMQFLIGQKAIFADLMWEFEAYEKGGLAELEKLYDGGQISYEGITAWRSIDSNTQSGIEVGNLILVRREQRIALGPMYEALDTKGLFAPSFRRGEFYDRAKSVFVGAPTFKQYLEQHKGLSENWFDYKTRMQYIEDVPIAWWYSFTPAQRSSYVGKSLDQLIELSK